ncbi:hypothetical protein E7L53_05295 [Priestia megaterium]|nr:hypothetical protein [Priestia megaterium]QCY23843.1 hypothetical protein EQG57_04350 [Priestia megaterium NBRC 15308 = ATCC 14581]THJ43322.1 hypothetical protein E7L53_05295 [Priestia megaterium]
MTPLLISVQQLEGPAHTKPTFTMTIKKHERSIFDRSFVFNASETTFLTFSLFNPLFSSPFCNAFDIIWSCTTAPSD